VTASAATGRPVWSNAGAPTDANPSVTSPSSSAQPRAGSTSVEQRPELAEARRTDLGPAARLARVG
jgi:hypothetical protein